MRRVRGLGPTRSVGTHTYESGGRVRGLGPMRSVGTHTYESGGRVRGLGPMRSVGTHTWIGRRRDVMGAGLTSDGVEERSALTEVDLLRWAEALSGIARTGLGFTQSLYERERFEEVLAVAADIRHAAGLEAGVEI